MLEAIISGSIISLSVSICIYFTIKKALNDIKLEIINELNEFMTSEKGQKSLYQIGAIVGSGIKQGSGMSQPKGKGGFQGLIGEIVGSYLQKAIETPPTNTKKQETTNW